MSKYYSQSQAKGKNKDDENDNRPSLRDVITRTLKHWQWIVISVVIFTGLGVLYVLRSPLQYVENAQVVIKNDGEGETSALGNISNFGLFSKNANVYNEIAAMSSPDVMLDVVKLLNLNIEYYAPGLFHKTALYGWTLPINVTFPDMEPNDALKFKVKYDKKGNFTVTKLKMWDKEKKKWIKSEKKSYAGKFDTPLKTEFGTILVTPTEYLADSEDYEIDIFKKSLKSTVNSYTQRVNILLEDDDSTVINLSLRDENRQRADEVIGAIIAVYNENGVNEKNQQALSASGFIDGRLQVIENELGHVDNDISEYKSANLVPDVVTMTQSYVKNQEEYNKRLVELEGQLEAAEGLRRRVIEAGNDGNALPGNTTIENQSLQLQIKEYNEILLKRNTLVSKSSDKNPVVVQMDAEMEQLRIAILSSVDNAIQGIKSRIKTVNQAKDMTTGQIASSPSQAKHLLSIERQQKVKENLYLFLLQKREDNELSQAFTSYNTRVIQKPGGTGDPVAPRKKVIILAAFLFGLFVPFAYTYVDEAANTKIRSRKDLHGLRTPLLGEIPFDKQLKKAKKGHAPQLLVQNGKRDVVNEAFRVLRTNLEFTRTNKDSCNVIAFTSFNPGSGKSLISMNIGASLALKGKRVLVIDGDFRRGSTSEYVDSPAKGLANYLAGHTGDIDSLIVAYPGEDNLYVLPMGSTPPNPTELLETPRFSQLIECLRNEYDYILIDCPPIELVADAQIIDTVSDRTIFVVRAGVLDKSLLRELDNLYEEKKFKHLAVILNGTANENIAYGTSKSYGFKK